MNQTLLHLEQTIGLGPTYAARLLGVAYVTYAQYRNGTRPLMLYHERHIEALLLLAPRVRQQLIEDRAYAGRR